MQPVKPEPRENSVTHDSGHQAASNLSVFADQPDAQQAASNLAGLSMFGSLSALCSMQDVEPQYTPTAPPYSRYQAMPTSQPVASVQPMIHSIASVPTTAVSTPASRLPIHQMAGAAPPTRLASPLRYPQAAHARPQVTPASPKPIIRPVTAPSAKVDQFLADTVRTYNTEGM